ATKRSRSACVINSCPSCTSPAWTVSIGHFYFAQIGHYHFALTKSEIALDNASGGLLDFINKATMLIRGLADSEFDFPRRL
ncbi:MAG: hypothetical protein ACKV22_03545, partial [Bryobacteraceae bacterium]